MNDGHHTSSQGPRHMRRKSRRKSVILISAAAVAATVALAVAVAVTYVGATAVAVNNNVHRSDVLKDLKTLPAAVPKLSQDTNILVMGLDTRVDEKGKPLPPEMYDALHAGDENIGGYNSNVLMLIHIPADGSKAAGISIPRDDYVQVDGIPGSGPFKAKIKEAYGYGFAAEKTSLINAGKPDDDTTYQAARDAGRKAEIATVTKFLGSVHIDHFLEVTMAAFYQTAQAIAPITVCVNKATQDTFSGRLQGGHAADRCQTGHGLRAAAPGHLRPDVPLLRPGPRTPAAGLHRLGLPPAQRRRYLHRHRKNAGCPGRGEQEHRG